MFVFYQQLHLKNFKGSSKIFEFVLSVSIFVGMIVGVGYLIFYGIRVNWWAPFIIFIISVIFGLVTTLLEKIVGSFTISLLGFAGMPIFAFMMFTTIPTSPKVIRTNQNINHFINSIDFSNQAAKISNHSLPFTDLKNEDIALIIDLKRKALNEALLVDCKKLNKRFDDFGSRFETVYIKGLTLLIDGYDNNNSENFISGQILLDNWGSWYSENFEKIKNK
jgi:hypothetical protein